MAIWWNLQDNKGKWKEDEGKVKETERRMKEYERNMEKETENKMKIKENARKDTKIQGNGKITKGRWTENESKNK